MRVDPPRPVAIPATVIHVPGIVEPKMNLRKQEAVDDAGGSVCGPVSVPRDDDAQGNTVTGRKQEQGQGRAFFSWNPAVHLVHSTRCPHNVRQ